MKNSIVERIADFLKDYQPFNSLSYPELITIATSIKVANLEKNKILFQIDDALHDSFYVVASGSVNLSVISDAEENLLSICRTGDIFGLRPFFAKNNYMMTAKAREESIVFAIPIVTFKPLLSENAKVLDFLLESFASTATFSKEKGGNKISDTVRLGDTQSEIQYFQALSYSKTPITSSATTSILEVAKLMTEHAMDNVLITNDKFPVGIVTDRDFRAKIATGQFSITSSINKIMSSPVITVAENPSLAEAQLLMLKHHVSHMCVTADGTDKSEIKGIITEHDLVVAQANNPGVLIKEIRRSSNAAELKKVKEKLLELIRVSITKNISISHISMISGEIIFAITKRAVELAILEIGSPPARFAWLNIGSQGRKEQILLSDQDSMLVFEDVEPERYRDVKDYFFKLAKRATSILENVGFELCSNGHIASNFLWCKSLSDWKKQYSNWINTLGENSDQIESIFFDYDLAYGEVELEDALTDTIFKNTKNNSLFFDYLGNETLKKPVPLNFFKKFNVEEEEGENKGKFDIKTRALIPLIDGARLLVLSQNIRGINNTYLRFKKLAIVEPKYEEVYLNCAEAFLILSKYRTLEGLKNDNSGQYINLNEISKSDKEKLKNAFLAFKELEEVIKDKFQLTHFS
jgi:CBS domain-containing protein